MSRKTLACDSGRGPLSVRSSAIKSARTNRSARLPLLQSPRVSLAKPSVADRIPLARCGGHLPSAAQSLGFRTPVRRPASDPKDAVQLPGDPWQRVPEIWCAFAFVLRPLNTSNRDGDQDVAACELPLKPHCRTVAHRPRPLVSGQRVAATPWVRQGPRPRAHRLRRRRVSASAFQTKTVEHWGVPGTGPLHCSR